MLPINLNLYFLDDIIFQKIQKTVNLNPYFLDDFIFQKIHKLHGTGPMQLVIQYFYGVEKEGLKLAYF